MSNYKTPSKTRRFDGKEYKLLGSVSRKKRKGGLADARKHAEKMKSQAKSRGNNVRVVYTKPYPDIHEFLIYYRKK